MKNETQLRDCYYIYRAVHDGVCPECGNTGTEKEPGVPFDLPAFVIENGDHHCRQCGFFITRDEINDITQQSQQILKRRLQSFYEWRLQRKRKLFEKPEGELIEFGHVYVNTSGREPTYEMIIDKNVQLENGTKLYCHSSS